MKKIISMYIYLLLTLLLMPMTVLGYSDYIIPGGESVGIEIKSDGIMVVGFYKVNGKLNKGTPNIKVGDKITKINGVEVDTISEMVDLMESNLNLLTQKVTIIRDGIEKTVSLELLKDEESYKTGLYVKDSISGIGTLTYIDPESKIYGALGHNIIESNTNKTVEVKTGSIFRSSITSIDRSVIGTPGGKNAKFYIDNTYGTIDKNTVSGIYGIYSKELPQKELLPIASKEEIELGKATIYTVLDKETQGSYEIQITKVDVGNTNKNIYFTVTDKELLEKTGGIVQGMSGSPIIQNGKIIGAVTHVVISNPTSGYGISIITMLEEGEKRN